MNGEHFEWRSNVPISNLNGWRWDFQRWALFQLSSSHPTGVLVADAAPWSGKYEDFPGIVSVRSTTVDHSLILATLQVFRDRQWEHLRKERKVDAESFYTTMYEARAWESGKMAFWTQQDRRMKKRMDALAAQSQPSGHTMSGNDLFSQGIQAGAAAGATVAANGLVNGILGNL
jgi:hypothetical protein